jgi:hypothetical protein
MRGLHECVNRYDRARFRRRAWPGRRLFTSTTLQKDKYGQNKYNLHILSIYCLLSRSCARIAETCSSRIPLATASSRTFKASSLRPPAFK